MAIGLVIRGGHHKKKKERKGDVRRALRTDGLTFEGAVQVVAEVAAPRLRRVLVAAGGRHLSLPERVAELDGRDGRAALGVVTVGRRVRRVVEEPARVGDAAHLRRRALTAQEVGGPVQVQQDADAAGAAARQHQFRRVRQTLSNPTIIPLNRRQSYYSRDCSANSHTHD